MKKICFTFQLHQPYRLKRYRFFDIGNDHYYFDDFRNEEIFRRATEQCYLPANRLMLSLIKQTKGAFRVTYAISGTALDQMEMYAPELIDSFVELAETGSIEFVAEPYAHSLSALSGDKDEFVAQVKKYTDKIQRVFGQELKVLRNPELLYDDTIAVTASELGFKGILTEGAKHILGWKSPNFVYKSAAAPDLKLLLRNASMSDNISKHFSRKDWTEYPLTADKYTSWIMSMPIADEILYLDMSYDTIGQMHRADSGIFDFFRALPQFILQSGIDFLTPSEAFALLTPRDSLAVPDTISWSEEEKNTISWLGNVLQHDAFGKLVQWSERTRLSMDRRIMQDWLYLQASDHFLYMSTSNSDVHLYRPYDSAYDAYNNYMNVLSDFILRVEAEYPSSIENEELSALLTTIQNQGDEIEELHKKIDELQSKNSKK